MITIENKRFKLIINDNCTSESLIYKPLSEECLFVGKKMPLFTITEKRPFNNEIKLAYPNKRTTFKANRIRKESDKLIIGFELVLFEAVVSIFKTDEYISFKLEEFIVPPGSFEGLAMDVPPVDEFRLMQLPIKKRTSFGEWLNVCFDENTAVNLLAVSPHERIDCIKEDEYFVLTADAVKDIKLKGCEAALIVSSKDELLDCIEAVEEHYNLPKGVKSRRSHEINSSIYWSGDVSPENVDKHISCMKKCGFTKFLIYFTALFSGATDSYAGIGEYKIRESFHGNADELKNMLDKIKAAGIAPGIHFLHTHIGFDSCYLTPAADHRLNLTRYFTLAKSLKENDDKIYVEENPSGTVMHEKCRILKFGGELIKYAGYTTEPPYYFYGCERGYNKTYIKSFDVGTIGGILDVSEYGATSVYINQNSSLQDEIAEKIADVYRLGFEFIYFDGSEGTNPPYEFHISNAQYRVYKKLDREPLFCEGAAKTHFGWHMLSGGNAFDIFPPEVFKEKLAEFPAAEADDRTMDFTRINFGWWNYNTSVRPDMYEYGTGIATAWNCPVTVQVDLKAFENNPRTDDICEVLKRWEDVRRRNLLTEEQRVSLKDTSKEHILLLNENSEYELAEYSEIKNAAGGRKNVSAFVFERNGKTYVVCWDNFGTGKLLLDISPDDFVYEDEIGGERISVEKNENTAVLPISKRRYFSSPLPKDRIIALFENAVYTTEKI